MRHFALNLIRPDLIKRKGGLKIRRLISATSDAYRAELIGLDKTHAIALAHQLSHAVNQLANGMLTQLAIELFARAAAPSAAMVPGSVTRFSNQRATPAPIFEAISALLH